MRPIMDARIEAIMKGRFDFDLDDGVCTAWLWF
jgi:hypothetical protein